MLMKLTTGVNIPTSYYGDTSKNLDRLCLKNKTQVKFSGRGPNIFFTQFW